jgi:hypothetical protein
VDDRVVSERDAEAGDRARSRRARKLADARAAMDAERSAAVARQRVLDSPGLGVALAPGRALELRPVIDDPNRWSILLGGDVHGDLVLESGRARLTLGELEVRVRPVDRRTTVLACHASPPLARCRRDAWGRRMRVEVPDGPQLDLVARTGRSLRVDIAGRSLARISRSEGPGARPHVAVSSVGASCPPEAGSGLLLAATVFLIDALGLVPVENRVGRDLAWQERGNPMDGVFGGEGGGGDGGGGGGE